MKEYVVLEGTRDWKEEVRRFYEEEEARVFFNALVEDYRRQGSKFTKNITGATKEWEVSLEEYRDEDWSIIDLEVIK